MLYDDGSLESLGLEGLENEASDALGWAGREPGGAAFRGMCDVASFESLRTSGFGGRGLAERSFGVPCNDGVLRQAQDERG